MVYGGIYKWSGFNGNRYTIKFLGYLNAVKPIHSKDSQSLLQRCRRRVSTANASEKLVRWIRTLINGKRIQTLNTL